MNVIKERRRDAALSSYPDLNVGDCVPFYFCPRSVMLHSIHMANRAELTYRGGQAPILHLEADLHETARWAEENGRRWAFTLSNAGAYVFEDRNRIRDLSMINWEAVHALKWGGAGVHPSVKRGKQAEFLVETWFPWTLVSRIGVHDIGHREQAVAIVRASRPRTKVEVLPAWYY